MNKIKIISNFCTVMLTVIVLACLALAVNCSAATECTRLTKYYSSLTYSGLTLSCSNSGNVNTVVASLVSTNKATTKYSGFSGYTKYAYVEIRNSEGETKSNVGGTTAASVTVNVNPAIFTPHAAVHKGWTVNDSFCGSNVHVIYTVKTYS